jgi:hypothetical protein
MSFLSSLLGLTTAIPDLIKGLFGWLNKKEDTAVVTNTNSKDVSVAVVQAEASRQHDALDVYKQMLSHPIFWCAWGLGVFPVMTYHAAVFFVSTFPMWGWKVLKVPTDQIEFSKTVIGNVFLLTGASTVVAGIASAWTKRA